MDWYSKTVDQNCSEFSIRNRKDSQGVQLYFERGLSSERDRSPGVASKGRERSPGRQDQRKSKTSHQEQIVEIFGYTKLLSQKETSGVQEDIITSFLYSS